MTPLSQLELNKIRDGLPRVLRPAAEHFLSTFLILVFLALLVGAAVFYKYSIVPEKMAPGPGDSVIKFDSNSYENILEQWRDREARSESAKTKEYLDIFNP